MLKWSGIASSPGQPLPSGASLDFWLADRDFTSLLEPPIAGRVTYPVFRTTVLERLAAFVQVVDGTVPPELEVDVELTETLPIVAPPLIPTLRAEFLAGSAFPAVQIVTGTFPITTSFVFGCRVILTNAGIATIPNLQVALHVTATAQVLLAGT